MNNRYVSYGHCEFCGHRTTKGAMLRHLRKCISAQPPAEGQPSKLYQLRIEGLYQPEYWLDVALSRSTSLNDLDEFLRATWLDCCGHMSAFIIGDYHYVKPYDGSFQIWDQEGDMHLPFYKALPEGLEEFGYEYDFGSTTHLKLRMITISEGSLARSGVRVLARNEAMDWRCYFCQEPAEYLCTRCIYEELALYCAKHVADHPCDEYAYLPVVNSPRMGVCGYEGPGEESWFS